MNRIMAFAIVFCLPITAWAQWGEVAEQIVDDALPGYYSGNSLLELAKGNRPAFIGYVLGVHDAGKAKMDFCTPPQATSGQIADVVFKYVQDNPATRDTQAHRLVSRALTEVWRCPSR